MNAIVLSLNEICSTDGAQNGLLGCKTTDKENIQHHQIDNLITQHKFSFLPSTHSFLPDRSFHRENPSESQFRKQKKHRIMSNRQKAMKKMKRMCSSQSSYPVAFTKPKNISSCKFCGSTEQGERITSCKQRKHLKSFSTEYVLGINKLGLENFIRKMEYDTKFDNKLSIPTSFISIGENSKSKHFFIHRAWDRSEIVETKTIFSNIILEFSYINKRGAVDSEKRFISGSALFSMLSACNIKKGPFFVFDKTRKKDSTYSHCDLTKDHGGLSLSQSSNHSLNIPPVPTFSQNPNQMCYPIGNYWNGQSAPFLSQFNPIPINPIYERFSTKHVSTNTSNNFNGITYTPL